MKVRLDWQFDEDGFEELDRPLLAARRVPSGATLASNARWLGRDPVLLNAGARSYPNRKDNPGRLWLIGSLIVIGCLVLLYILA
ncbi:MAG: hypothetical protein PVG33_06270 [Chloroflexota bacterium]|jgi:hypothetical protein